MATFAGRHSDPAVQAHPLARPFVAVPLVWLTLLGHVVLVDPKGASTHGAGLIALLAGPIGVTVTAVIEIVVLRHRYRVGFRGPLAPRWNAIRTTATRESVGPTPYPPAPESALAAHPRVGRCGASGLPAAVPDMARSWQVVLTTSLDSGNLMQGQANCSDSEAIMALRFIGIDPNTGGNGSATVWVKPETQKILIQGEFATPADRSEIDGTEWVPGHVIGIPSHETVIEIPAHMVPILREACDVAEREYLR